MFSNMSNIIQVYKFSIQVYLNNLSKFSFVWSYVVYLNLLRFIWIYYDLFEFITIYLNLLPFIGIFIIEIYF